MSRKKYKKRDKVTQKMSRGGLVQRNEATGEDIRVSKRDMNYDFRSDTPTSEAFEIDAEVKRKSSLSQVGTRMSGQQSESAAHKKRATYRHATQQQVTSEISDSENSIPSIPPAQIFTQIQLENPRNDEHVDDEIPLYTDNSYNPPQPQGGVNKSTTRGNSALYQTERPSSLQLATQADNSPIKHNLQAVTSALVVEKPTEALVSTRSPPPPADKNKKYRTRQNTVINYNTDSVLHHQVDKPKSPLTHKTDYSDNFSEENPQTTAKTQDILPSQQFNQPTPAKQTKSDCVMDSDKPITTPLPTEANSSSSQTTPNATPESALEQKKPSKLKFSDDETAPVPRIDRHLIRAEQQADRANAKLEKARNNLPAKRTLHAERVFDEKRGNATTKICFDKEIKSQAQHAKGSLPLRPVKVATNALMLKAHAKIYQVENENVAVKAVHKVELAGEGAVRSALYFHKNAPYRQVERLEKQAAKKSRKLAYRKALAENPKLKSNVFSRMIQKQKIRRQYAKVARDTKNAATGTKKIGNVITRTSRFAVKIITKNPKTILALAIIGAILIILMSMFSMGASIFSGGFTSIVASSHLSEDADIEQAALTFSELETILRIQILDVEANHPGFDEYRINTGVIGHCPMELMAYLTAVHHIFTDVSAHLYELFADQYQLEFIPSVEIRQRWVTRTDLETGESYSVLEPYEWSVLTVTLTSRPFRDVLMSRMSDNQQEHFAMIMQTNGNRQIAGSPFDFNWQPFISSHFGWRVHPIFGGKSMHNGIDIGLPTGTEIRAAHDGIITFAGYAGGYGNFIVIDRGDGIVTRYAHCDTILVTVGQTVMTGEVIGTVGNTGDSTGPHLHFEILYHGEFRNPAFFAHMG